jgi:DUF1680 family protein
LEENFSVPGKIKREQIIKKWDTVMSFRKYVPVDFEKVEINDGFWSSRIETNRENTIPVIYDWSKKSGRIAAWKWKEGLKNKPHIFWDSDMAKWIEAAAYSLVKNPDSGLERKIDHVVGLMAETQLPDGYLNSYFINVEPDKRWTNLRDRHELYCAGHLIEAAIAYYRATDKRKFLDIMLKYVDHIAKIFGRSPGQKRGYCGHEEIELALIKLYELTDDEKHLELAAYFINERGQEPNYFLEESKLRGETGNQTNYYGKKDEYLYFQADKPLREQVEALGHAVRAGYIFSGMASLCANDGDKKLFEACKRLFNNIMLKKMYITGGIGSEKRGEAFSYDYNLHNESAYSETCAAISLVFFAHRMLQLELNSDYADVMERALYNGVLSGVSLDGKAFFYSNPLAANPKPGNDVDENVKTERQKWFGCSCCPSNVARLLASLGSYIYTRSEDEICINLFISGSASIDMENNPVAISQKTNYPWDGKVSVKVAPQTPADFKVCVRIPGWCGKYSIRINGVKMKLPARNGYVMIKRRWDSGDSIDIDFEMQATFVEADPRLRHDCGKVAIQRGPLVYCVEEADNGKFLYDVSVDTSNPAFSIIPGTSILKGVKVIVANASRRKFSGWGGRLYRPLESRLEKIRLKAIPYFVWANRKSGEMTVWLNRG